jgi:hypothetical protein
VGKKGRQTREAGAGSGAEGIHQIVLRSENSPVCILRRFFVLFFGEVFFITIPPASVIFYVTFIA